MSDLSECDCTFGPAAAQRIKELTEALEEIEVHPENAWDIAHEALQEPPK